MASISDAHVWNWNSAKTFVRIESEDVEIGLRRRGHYQGVPEVKVLMAFLASRGIGFDQKTMHTSSLCQPTNELDKRQQNANHKIEFVIRIKLLHVSTRWVPSSKHLPRLAFWPCIVLFLLGGYIYIYISDNCNCVAIRWQQYSTHLHTNSTQNNTMKQNIQNGTYITVRIHKYNNKNT